jgi:acetolactate synthase-1/2/3 large subunit
MSTHVEAIARTLASRGVESVFGLPGGEILAFVDACRRAGLRFLLAGHEASAAWMAQAVGELTGLPGVCAATSGPGAANLVTGVASAWLDRAPMLAITADMPAAASRTMTHQRLPLNALFSPIAKASNSIGEADTSSLVNHAFDLAIAPRPGPVHIGVPSDLAARDSATRSVSRSEPRAESGGNSRILDIAARLAEATRPLVLIGLGARPVSAPLIAALIDKLQSPFLTTAKAKGIVREDHPLFAGVASGMALDREIVETIRASDLVLAIGFDPVECDKTWFAEVEIAAIDAVSMAEGDYRPCEAIGDIPALAGELLAGIAEPKPWPRDLFDRCRNAIRRAPFESADGLSPLRLIEELRCVFPRGGIAACDVGSHKLALGQYWETYQPATFLVSNGLSSMGFGIPAAIAAQLVHPDRPVMAMVGDGGMLMMLHNLLLIRELALPILVVVFVDHSLSLIRVSAERRGFPPCGVDFRAPDFVRAAEAYGIAARRAGSIHEVRACVEQALSDRVPFLLEVPVDLREYYELV